MADEETEGQETGADASGAGVDPAAVALALGGASRDTADGLGVLLHSVDSDWRGFMNRICQIAFGVVFVVIGAAPAFAEPLTESDYAYLSSELKVSKAEMAVNNYSDDNKARLHGLINDPATAKDPTARQSAIVDYLLGVLDGRLRGGLVPP